VNSSKSARFNSILAARESGEKGAKGGRDKVFNMETTELSRRSVLAGAAGITLAGRLDAKANTPLPLGMVISLRHGGDPAEAIARVRKFGFSTCQIGVGAFSKEAAKQLRKTLEEQKVQATALVELGPGPMVWNFYEGPLTIGLIPPATRKARMEALKRAADFAEQAGIPAVHTHCGFIPENPNDPDYRAAVGAIKEVAGHCKERGRQFFFETGQETPVTLLRAINDVGLDNLGVNLDTANLILYGKGNPVDALDVIGTWVRGMHAKDGLFPTNPRELGKEVAIGKGRVDFRKVFTRLKELNYTGPVTIEREISGPEQTKDILASKSYLEGVLREVYGS
jgi:L-ribulose-5-phosphate 3-epimerase